MRTLFFLLIFLISATNALAQMPALYSMNTEWDDKLTQWEIKTMDEEVNGSLSMVWEALNRIDEWVFDFEGVHGRIKMNKLGNKEQWELRIGNDVVAIRQLWPNDFSEWRITDNTTLIDFTSPNRRDAFFWSLKDEDRYGKFQVYTEYEGDPRDWIIIDELPEDFNFALKMAMVFTPIIPLLPRE